METFTQRNFKTWIISISSATQERTAILDLLLQVKKESFDDTHAEVFIGEVY